MLALLLSYSRCSPECFGPTETRVHPVSPDAIFLDAIRPAFKFYLAAHALSWSEADSVKGRV